MTKGVFMPGKAPKTELCRSIVSILATQHGEKRASHTSLIILSTYLTSKKPFSSQRSFQLTARTGILIKGRVTLK